MIIIHENNVPLACFTDHEEGHRFYKELPPELKEKYKTVARDLSYPYYWLWTWDRSDFRNKEKWKREIVDAQGVDDYVKTLNRDMEWERTVDETGDDDQYFYLGIVYEDGISYGLRQELGMPTDDYSAFSQFDHEHVVGHTLARLKSMGVRRAMIQWTKEVKYKKVRRLRHKIRRLTSLGKREQLTPKLVRKGGRLLQKMSKLTIEMDSL